jgi:hypothetical protein
VARAASFHPRRAVVADVGVAVGAHSREFIGADAADTIGAPGAHHKAAGDLRVAQAGGAHSLGLTDGTADEWNKVAGVRAGIAPRFLARVAVGPDAVEARAVVASAAVIEIVVVRHLVARGARTDVKIRL